MLSHHIQSAKSISTNQVLDPQSQRQKQRMMIHSFRWAKKTAFAVKNLQHIWSSDVVGKPMFRE